MLLLRRGSVRGVSKSVLFHDFSLLSRVSLLIVLLPVPLETQFIHMCSQPHAYTVHANQYKHIVIHTTTAATIHIQPQKQDGCVGFVALLRFFDCMLVYFSFHLAILFRFSPF